jgi:hypothetical protein
MMRRNIFLQILIDVTTVSTGKDYCCVRIMGWLILFFGCGMIAYTVIVLKQPFQYDRFFSGVAWLPPAVGGAIWMKKGDEPGNKPPDAS